MNTVKIIFVPINKRVAKYKLFNPCSERNLFQGTASMVFLRKKKKKRRFLLALHSKTVPLTGPLSALQPTTRIRILTRVGPTVTICQISLNDDVLTRGYRNACPVKRTCIQEYSKRKVLFHFHLQQIPVHHSSSSYITTLLLLNYYW